MDEKYFFPKKFPGHLECTSDENEQFLGSFKLVSDHKWVQEALGTFLEKNIFHPKNRKFEFFFVPEISISFYSIWMKIGGKTERAER